MNRESVSYTKIKASGTELNPRSSFGLYFMIAGARIELEPKTEVGLNAQNVQQRTEKSK
jgi:hypothetical protein